LVRAAADRVFLPTKSLLEQVGDMMRPAGRLVSAVRPPYPYGSEFVQQFLFMLRLCWLPLTITTIAFGYGAPGLQAGNFLVIFGAIDRLGGFFVLATIREFAPIASAVILAGVGGTAITADQAPARSARSSTRCRCSASTRSRTSSYRAFSR
jgi:phospholipid/cholesterol/gamma-HCH transport system permease protein